MMVLSYTQKPHEVFMVLSKTLRRLSVTQLTIYTHKKYHIGLSVRLMT